MISRNYFVFPRVLAVVYVLPLDDSVLWDKNDMSKRPEVTEPNFVIIAVPN